jgi:hypothetical protein
VKHLDELLPRELCDEYATDATVHAIFKRALTIGQSREAALVACVKAVVASRTELLEAFKREAALSPGPVLRFEVTPGFVQAVERARAERPPDAPLTVHLLSEGRALCGKPGVPGNWDPAHRWVSAHNDDFGQRANANCPACLAAVTEREP